MRTTMTLDDDVAALIESERARTGESFRAAVNRLLRRNARAGPSAAPPALPKLPGEPILGPIGAARRARRRASCTARRHVMLVDTNLLVYATFAGVPEHERARGWLEERLAEGEGTVDLC